MRRWFCILAISAVILPAQGARPSAQDNLGQVSGIVVDGKGRPLADVRVNLRPVHSNYTDSVSVPTAPNTPNRDVITASNGTFLFTAVLPGRYFLVAHKTGYVGGYFGQEKIGDEMQWFNLHPGEKTTAVSLRLFQGGTISGVVRSTAGLPLPNRFVQVVEVRHDSGVPDFLSLQAPVRTDDQGRYSFGGLSTGFYLVRTTANEPRLVLLGMSEYRTDSADVYYPNLSLAEARSVVPIDAPAERMDIDITIPDAPRGVEISGRITGVPDAPIDRRVRLVLDDPGTVLPPYVELAATAIESDGSFAFPKVPPGRYRIRALLIPSSADHRLRVGRHMPGAEGTGPGFDERAVWLNEPVVVRDEPLTKLALQTSPGLRVTGKLSVTGELVLDRSRLVVEARSLDGWNLSDLPVGWSDTDGNFASPAMPAGRYVVSVSSRELRVESMILRQQDVTDLGIELTTTDVSGAAMTLTTLLGEITGRVTDNAGKARADANILCVRQDSNWLDASGPAVGLGAFRVRTDALGQYTLSLGAGSYAVMALVGDMPLDFHDKDFLRSMLPKAVTLSVPRGRRVIQNLEVQTIRK